MRGWEWLTESRYTLLFVVRVFIKAIVLFIAANLIFAIVDPIPLIGQISIYNLFVPGRERLPYGESSAAYNLSLNSLEAMFSSHTVSRKKADNEFRVLVMGDSSVWGVLLDNLDTLTGKLNAASLDIRGKQAEFYNLGHPIMSATKDLMLMDYGMRYQPDLIMWLVTLESLPYPKQIEAPLVQNNAARVQPLIERYQLQLDVNDARFVQRDFWGRTLVGQRRALADWWRLQLYGINWAATGIDQLYKDYEPRSNDLDTDISWQGFTEANELKENTLATDIIKAGTQVVGDIPLIIVNEPIFVADGVNSDLRYNFWYPKWAYDRYRAIMQELAAQNGWHYIDLWDAISPSEFTDSPVHLTPQGSAQLGTLLGDIVSEWAATPN
ncbi:MAG: SGNH/GDSL hydrolase family protein [Chloroflexi bacterium]|nr:SGNH/GDSL hydrolase family protein [Chloroflexota bacterium]MCC6894115.1 SGNH/GDSL hydrolase family protein [Anaerolineae bacterium]